MFLDAGHGGPDPGADATASGGRIFEKDLTLPVVQAAARLLRADGYRVVLSRTTETAINALRPGHVNQAVFTTAGKHNDLLARVRCANLGHAAAAVSVHFDAYSDTNVRGCTTLYDTARPFSDRSAALAALLQRNVLASLATAGWSTTDRGVVSDSTAGGGEITPQGTAYGHLDILGAVDPGYVDESTTMPGALIEPLFISNPAEATAAVSARGQQAIAAGVADAVQQFLP